MVGASYVNGAIGERLPIAFCQSQRGGLSFCRAGLWFPDCHDDLFFLIEDPGNIAAKSRRFQIAADGVALCSTYPRVSFRQQPNSESVAFPNEKDATKRRHALSASLVGFAPLKSRIAE